MSYSLPSITKAIKARNRDKVVAINQQKSGCLPLRQCQTIGRKVLIHPPYSLNLAQFYQKNGKMAHILFNTMKFVQKTTFGRKGFECYCHGILLTEYHEKRKKNDIRILCCIIGPFERCTQSKTTTFKKGKSSFFARLCAISKSLKAMAKLKELAPAAIIYFQILKKWFTGKKCTSNEEVDLEIDKYLEELDLKSWINRNIWFSKKKKCTFLSQAKNEQHRLVRREGFGDSNPLAQGNETI